MSPPGPDNDRVDLRLAEHQRRAFLGVVGVDRHVHEPVDVRLDVTLGEAVPAQLPPPEARSSDDDGRPVPVVSPWQLCLAQAVQATLASSRGTVIVVATTHQAETLAARLNHPHIVAVFDLVAEGTSYSDLLRSEALRELAALAAEARTAAGP